MGDQIRKNERDGAHRFERKGTYRGLVEKPVGQSILGRSRGKWEDNIEVNFQGKESGREMD